MNIGTILIVVSSIGLAIALASIFFVKSKKKKDKPKEASKPQKQEQPEQKNSEDFKINRKSKSARVSKKALSSNARTATIEKVFEHDTAAEPVDTQVEPEKLGQDDEELISAISQIAQEERKVVSIGTLAKEIDAKNKTETKQSASQKTYTKPDKQETINTNFNELEFLQNVRREARREQPEEQKEKNFSDMIEAEAILNPKFKNKK